MTGERCTVCNVNFPLRGTICHPCKNGEAYNQDQDQDQDQVFIGDDENRFAPSSMPLPGPGRNDDAPMCARALVVEGEEAPEMRRLEEAHRRGQLEPVAVRLGELPPGAGRVMRAIADHLRLRMGLRLAVGDDRPLPYATSEAVRARLAKDKATASNAIRALVRAGVIEDAGALPPLRPGLDGTKLYRPPSCVPSRVGESAFVDAETAVGIGGTHA